MRLEQNLLHVHLLDLLVFGLVGFRQFAKLDKVPLEQFVERGDVGSEITVRAEFFLDVLGNFRRFLERDLPLPSITILFLAIFLLNFLNRVCHFDSL